MIKLSLASFRVNLIVLSMIIILPALGLMIYDGIEQIEVVHKSIAQEALSEAYNATQEQQHLIMSSNLFLEAFSKLPAVQERDTEECSRTAAQMIRDLPQYANLAVVDELGEVNCSAVPMNGATNLADRSWFRRAISTKQFVVGDYIIGRITNRPVLVMAKPIMDEEGVVVQVAYVALDLSWLHRFVQTNPLHENDAFFASDQIGTTLFYSPITFSPTGAIISNPDLLAAILSQKEQIVPVKDNDGVDRLYALIPLHPRSQTGNVVFGVGIPVADALAGARMAMYRNIGGLAIVTLLAMAAAWFGGDIFFLRRIRAISTAARKLADGDLSARTGITYGRSELSQMAEVFDSMAVAMQEQQAITANAVEALGRSETRYRRLAENAPDIIFRYRTTPEPGFDFVSPACTRITGYTPEEFYQNPQLAKLLVCPDGTYLWQADGQQLGQVIQQWVRKDGQIIWTNQHSSAVLDEAGNVAAIEGILGDITEKKKAEDMLKRRLAELRVMYTVTGVAIQAVDEDDLIQRVSEAIGRSLFPESFGLYLYDDASGTMLPHRSYRKVAYQDNRAVRAGEGLIGRVYQTGEPALVDNLLATGDDAPYLSTGGSGLAVPLELNGKVIGVLAAASSQPDQFAETDLSLMQMLAHELSSVMERLRLNRQTETRLQQLLSLRRIDLAITTSFDIDIPLQVLLEEAFTNLPIQAAGVLLYHPETNTLRKAAHFHLDRQVGDPAEANLREWIPAETGLVHGFGAERVFVPDLRLEYHPRARRLAAAGFISCYSMPLVAKGQFIGLFQVFSRKPMLDDAEQTGYLEMLAGQAAIALDNARLFSELQNSNQELQQAYDDTIAGWSRAMDLRDGETEDHSRRVADMTIQLADRMGYPPEKLAILRRGALLHDLGKMAVPDGILSKPGKLDEEEWAIMRRHPQHALDMLGSIAFLRPALTIPYCHHEKWDGSGYPRGLKGELIPLEARIFSVVDVWDALTSDRPYRKRWPKEATAEYIREQAGKHFDPRVVKVFLALLQEEQLVLSEDEYSGD